MVKEETVPERVESPLGDKDSDTTDQTPDMPGAELYIRSNEIQVADLYNVGSEEPKEVEIKAFKEVPFVHPIILNGPRGENIRVRGVFDSGAMVNAMCTAVFAKIKHRLSALKHSIRRLRMANGTVIPSMGRWEGQVNIGGKKMACAFEVFPSGGSWAFLVG
jgi:hypothetical protein